MRGKLYIVRPHNRGFIMAQIAEAPEGHEVILREPKRSDEQNRRFHAMIDDLVSQKPDGRTHDKETWKAIVLRALGKEVRFAPDLDGEMFPIGIRSSSLTVREMSDAMEIMAAYGAERGVVWRDPKEAA